MWELELIPIYLVYSIWRGKKRLYNYTVYFVQCVLAEQDWHGQEKFHFQNELEGVDILLFSGLLG